MRIAVAGLWHETHTFASTPTTLDDFRRFDLLEGTAILHRHARTQTNVGGLIDGARQTGLDLIPVFYAGAMPSGPVTAEAHAQLEEQLLNGLRRAGAVDGLLAPLHGAMVAEDVDDAEGRLLQEMRRILGPERPIVATLDFHANISRLMVSAADLLIGYDTYPHRDAYERGLEACQLMWRLLEDGLRPAPALEKPALLPVPQGMCTDASPMREIMAMAHEMEAQEGILTITVAGGFPYSDVERAGMGFLVTAVEDAALSRARARELAAYAWDHRHEFRVEQVPVQEGVRRAISAERGPAILVDAADNIGGGAPGDGTTLLAELLNQGAKGAVVVIADPQSVGQCFAAGLDGKVSLRVGGKTDDRHGQPVPIRGRVRLLGDGTYRNAGPYMPGQEVRMGSTAVVEANGIQLVLTERKTPPFDAQQLRSLGIEPAQQRIIVVKSAIAWRAAFGDVAAEVIDVATPGLCTVQLEQLPYRKVRRPIFPLDPI